MAASMIGMPVSPSHQAFNRAASFSQGNCFPWGR